MMTVQQVFELAVRHHQAGRLADAEALYRRILSVQPQHADSVHMLGALAHQVGRYDLAVELISQAIALNPAKPAPYSNLAAAYLANGCAVEAMTQSQRAVELNPKLADAHYNLGAALAELGRPEEAAASYARALEIQPHHLFAENNRGNILRQLGRLDEAIESYRKVLRAQPDHPDAHNNLGVALAEKGQFDEAIESYQRALQGKPEASAIYKNLGNAFQSAGRYEEAVAAYRHALRLDPQSIETLHKLGNAWINLGNLEEATAVFRQWARSAPDSPLVWSALGKVLKQQGDLDRALASFRRVLELDPNDAHAYCRVGHLLQTQGHRDQAAAAYQRAVELQESLTEAHYRLAEIYRDQGRGDEAQRCLRRVLKLAPDAARFHSDLILMLLIDPDVDDAAVTAECRRWNEEFAAPLKPLIRPHANDRDPDRLLRIGYVSADFRDHVVGRNLFPLLRAHDRSRFEIVCYSGAVQPDEITETFQGYADQWRNVLALSDEAVAELVREDSVDVLIDLSLHTAGNRLPMFARKPAPVQVSFAGYPGSTGVDTIAYRISDRFLERVAMPGKDFGSGEVSEILATSGERIMLIDSFWCYDPCGVELQISPLPAERNGFVTFGCLNDFSKINERVLKGWARVLKEVEGSRLMLLSYEGSHRQRTVDFLEREGVAGQRVEFFTPRPRKEYLALYHRADIMLDPFPYNGHTTSLDALWMGVPVVSMAGERLVSRAGLSQLSNLDLLDCVASSEDEYVTIAGQLARDRRRLKDLRQSLRPRMKGSVLMDADRFARNVEGAYRRMWRNWCNAETDMS